MNERMITWELTSHFLARPYDNLDIQILSASTL